jgi:ferredoxin
MEPGDTVEVEIVGIGRLTNPVAELDVDLSGAGDQPVTSAQTLHVALAIPESEAERMVEERTAPMTRVHVDMNLCQSHGECVYVAPDIFELGDDDVLRWREEIRDDEREVAQEAADACPMLAIRLSD